MSAREHSAAIRALLDVPLGQWSAYEYGTVPATLPDIYVLITVTQRFGGEPRGDGRRPFVGWRLTTLAVGRTVSEALWAREKVDAALREQRIPALSTSLVEFESENPIEPDDGRYSGVTVWTYSTNA